MNLIKISAGILLAIGWAPEPGTNEALLMWNLVNCYLSGRHDYGMWCEPGAIFLRCVHCGKRSSGWAVDAKHHAPVPALRVQTIASPKADTRVIPFGRAVAR